MGYFTKQSVREKHRQKVQRIINELDGNRAVEAIVNYLMNRIANVISYERSKWERRIGCSRSNENGKVKKAKT